MSDPDRLNKAIEALLADRSPADFAGDLDLEDQRMLRMAQLLRGSHTPVPDARLVTSLRARLQPQAGEVSRRAAFLSGLGGLAAGVLAAVGVESAARHPKRGWTTGPIQPNTGKWVHVSDLADVPEGSVRGFEAGGVHGFLIHRDGAISALSRTCTHMGCSLDFDATEKHFVCPCHGAEFDMRGRFRYYPRNTDHITLAPLNPIAVRLRGSGIEVLGT